MNDNKELLLISSDAIMICGYAVPFSKYLLRYKLK